MSLEEEQTAEMQRTGEKAAFGAGTVEDRLEQSRLEESKIEETQEEEEEELK